MDRKLRIGVLGCGPISQFAYLEACRRAKNAELYAICDVAEDLLLRMTEIHRPKAVYTDYDQMLADHNVDAVIIGTSDAFHVPFAMRALDAGKHVLVEKPLGISVEECEALGKRVEALGLTLQVGNMKRFDPGIQFARNYIQQEMGERIALKAWYCDSTYRYTITDNIQPILVKSDLAKKPSIDQKEDKQRYYMLAHGSHLVDTARYLGGEIVSVRTNYTNKFDAHCWFVTVEFEAGYFGHLDLTVAVRMDWHEGFHIYGENGSVMGKTYHPWLFKASEVEAFSKRTETFTRPLGADAHVFKLQVEGFVDTILNGTAQVGASVYDGITAIRTLAAIVRSAETGTAIRPADVTGAV